MTVPFYYGPFSLHCAVISLDYLKRHDGHGLRSGDLIMSIDGIRVESIANMKTILEKLNASDGPHTINIIRNQKGQNLLVRKKLELISEKPTKQ